MVAIVIALIGFSVGFDSAELRLSAIKIEIGTTTETIPNGNVNANGNVNENANRNVNTNGNVNANGNSTEIPFRGSSTDTNDKNNANNNKSNVTSHRKRSHGVAISSSNTTTTTEASSTGIPSTASNDNNSTNNYANSSSSIEESERTPPPPPPPSLPQAQAPVLTLLVMLSGEFGNNLFKIFRGFAISRLALREFGLATRIVLAEQRRGGTGRVYGKARRTTAQLKACFVTPDFGAVRFGLGNRLLDDNYFHEIKIPNSTFTLSDKRSSIQNLTDHLGELHNYLRDHPELFAENDNTSSSNNNNDDDNDNDNDNNNTSSSNDSNNDNGDNDPPRLMVRVDSLMVYPVINEFYDDIRNEFVFDDANCCGKTLEEPPEPDESVLHLRNYATEMKESRRNSLGFSELPGHRLVDDVLGHLQQGDKLALTGRNLENDSRNNETEAYELIRALRAKNLTLRFSPGSSGMEDFCFLKSAQKELIGTSKSTYLALAAYLANDNMTVARMYQYVTPSIPATSLGAFRETVGDNWTHPQLQSRIRFEEYYPPFRRTLRKQRR
jgi:hypothetical protein